MALVTGGRLAAAVSRAGGLGIVGGGYAGLLGGEPDLEQELALVTGQRFGVGFITWALERNPRMLDIALAQASEPGIQLQRRSQLVWIPGSCLRRAPE
jgi:nitronate monooxygenase